MSEARSDWARCRTIAAGVLLAVIAGCAKAPTDNEEAIVTASGERISAGLFAHYVQDVAKAPPERLDPAYRQRLLGDLERLLAAAQVAEKTTDADTRYELELQRLEFLAREGARKAGVFDAPPEAEVLAAYKSFVLGRPASEFRVAHILVPTEAIALDIVRRLQQGANFAEIARKESADESKNNGGELGWVYPGKLPKEFTAAVQALTVGQYTVQPVRTQYGWHVIELLETRGTEAPPLEAVRVQVLANLQQERFEHYLDQALKQKK